MSRSRDTPPRRVTIGPKSVASLVVMPMPDDDSFAGFIQRIRAGDARAAEELVRRYESDVRVAVRARLTDPLLRRQLDSLDVCQSVFASFFVLPQRANTS